MFLNFLSEFIISKPRLFICTYRFSPSIFHFLSGLYTSLTVRAASRIQAYDPERLKAFQLKRLRQLLEYAGSNVAFWQEYFRSKDFNPRNIRNISDLRHLPYISRNDLKNRSRDYSDKDFDRALVWHTSGSTGEPVDFYFDLASARSHSVSMYYRLKFLGFTTSLRILRFMIVPQRKIDFGVYHGDIMGDFAVAEERQKLYEFLERYKPEVFLGWPTIIEQLMDFMKKDSFQFSPVSPKIILAGADYLPPQLGRELKRFFKCPVFGNYATSELGVLAQECQEADGYHINVNNVLIEVVDDIGEPLSYEKTGRVLVTHFDRRPMLFIRYEVGDFGYITDKLCRCGAKTPRIFLEGRRTHSLLLSDNARYPLIRLMKLIDIRYSRVIKKYRFIQESINKITVEVMPMGRYHSGYRALLSKDILDRLGGTASIAVDIREVTSIEDLPSGKAQVFISKIKA